MRPRLERPFHRLEDARSRALALLEGLGPAALNRPPGPGRWSALQVLHHVVESEAGTLGYVHKKMQAGAGLPRSIVASGLRRATLQVALALPVRFRAPAVAASVPDAIDPDALRARWAEVRRSWQELLDGFPPELDGRLVFRHPVGGRLCLADTLAVLLAHLEHHVPQVKRALGG